MDWTELGAGCWVRRYAEWDVNVGVVAGINGLLVVDTRGTNKQGHDLRDDVRRLDRRGVRWVANTHAHFDHVLGNLAFDEARIHAHDNVAAGLDAATERVRELCRAEDPDDPLNRAVIESEVRHPDETFASSSSLDLGDRTVALSYLGSGHTDGDVLVRVPDLGITFAGDLVEESAPPSFGPDSYPLDWPATLKRMLDGDDTGEIVVPGHGAPVDRAFVVQQHADVAAVADTITDLLRAGVPVEDALATGTWPWEPERLGHAVRRGYAQGARETPGRARAGGA
jgi:glyoxylase-like metal-dependent hydrolase (beta-lactamase superfamily II)